MRAVIMLPLLLAGLAGCEKAPSGRAPVTEAEALKIAETTETNYAKDAKTIGTFYSPKAVVFDAAHVEPTDDQKVASSWTQEFVSMKPADFAVANRHIQVTGPDSFVNSGIARFTVEAGQARPQVGVRFSQVYSRGKDGSWKIVHEHMSMPPTPAGQPQQ